MLTFITALLAATTLATTPMQEGREGAADFVREVYASYQEDQPWPIDEARLDAVWSPHMAALIRRDRELASDEMPYLDADPICNCQDFEDIRVLDARASWSADNRVLVTVRFVNGGHETTNVFRMAGNPVRGWRIDAVVNTEGYPDLSAALAESNQRIEQGGRAAGRE